MKPDAPSAPDSHEESTGLPWVRSWRGVYAIVVGSFVLWVVMLTLLREWFS